MESLQNLQKNIAVRLLIMTGAVILVLKFLVPLMSPFIMAMLFLTIFGPLLQHLQKVHINRQVGAVMLIAMALTIMTLLIYFVCHRLWQGIPELMELAEDLKRELPDWADRLLDLGIDGLQKGSVGMESSLLGGALRYTGRVAAFGAYLITFVIAVVLLAKDYDEMMNGLLEREDCLLLLSVICGVIRYIATFVKAQAFIMAAIATICALVLTALGIHQGIFLGLLAGLLDALPFIGTGVVLMPVALVQAVSGRFGCAVCCVILYAACIFLREIMEPRLIGKRIGVRSIAVLISLYLGIHLFGVPGIVKGPLGFVILREVWQQKGQKTTDISKKQ